MSDYPNDYIPVYVANGKLAAEMIRLMLEAQGIPAIILQESVGESFGLTMTPLGEVAVYVPASQKEEALHILQAMEEGRLETNASLTDGDESVEEPD